MPNEADPEAGMSPEMTRKIIYRAAILDSIADDFLSEAEVRAIADELGISQEAITQAIAELPAARHDDGWRNRIQQLGQSFAVRSTVPGVLLGPVVSAASLFLGTGPWIAGLIGTEAWLALTVSGKRKALQFQSRNLGFWLALALSWPVVHGYVPGDLAIVTVTAGSIAAVGGAVLVWLKQKLGLDRWSPADLTRSERDSIEPPDVGQSDDQLLRVRTGGDSVYLVARLRLSS
jgi:hypothetical protein